MPLGFFASLQVNDRDIHGGLIWFWRLAPKTFWDHHKKKYYKLGKMSPYFSSCTALENTKQIIGCECKVSYTGFDLIEFECWMQFSGVYIMERRHL